MNFNNQFYLISDLFITQNCTIRYKLMHLDPNSLFEEIGLNQQLTFQKPHRLLTSLQIQVSEDQICHLEVRQHDDPYLIALNFCSEYQLNEIAVGVIEKKVQEILEKHRIDPTHFTLSKKQKERQQRGKYYQKERQPNSSKNTEAKQIKKKTPAQSQKQLSSDIGSKLYEKGLKSLYKTQQYRIQQQMEKQAEGKRQLTFKPKINEVSQKIVEVRKIMGGNPHPHRLRNQNVQKINDELQQCTFKPAINKESERIVQQKYGRNQEEFVEKLYYDSIRAEIRKNKRRVEQKEEYTYKPTINEKSRIQIRDTFMERLQKDKQSKKQKQLRSLADDQHCSFTPEIGRPPKVVRNKQNLPIGDYLSQNYQTRSKSELSRANFQSISESVITNKNKNSETIYQNLVKKRIQQLFELLDGNKDGFISPDHIDIQQLSSNTLLLLQPFFKEMEELGAVLDERLFSKAIFKLLDISPQSLKGEFISQRWRKIPDKQFTFKPKLNNKSARIAQQRTAVSLYQQGIQAKRRKQVYTAILQAKKQEEQLQQCTFKPLLNSGSQIYARRYIDKRHNDDSLEREIYSEQNQQI